MRISLLFTLAACLFASSAWGNDTVARANLDIRTLPGAAGYPAQATDEFRFLDGAYVCRNSATRSTPHIARFPFMLPKTRELHWANVEGRRTSDSSPMKLSMRKVCAGPSVPAPTVTIISTVIPSPDADGYFSTYLPLFGERPDGQNCKYWLEAEFDISSIKCTSGVASIKRFRIENTVFDRIFRGSFHTNVTTDAP